MLLCEYRRVLTRYIGCECLLGVYEDILLETTNDRTMTSDSPDDIEGRRDDRERVQFSYRVTGSRQSSFFDVISKILIKCPKFHEITAKNSKYSWDTL